MFSASIHKSYLKAAKTLHKSFFFIINSGMPKRFFKHKLFFCRAQHFSLVCEKSNLSSHIVYRYKLLCERSACDLKRENFLSLAR